MAVALRPNLTCFSIHSRCGSQALRACFGSFFTAGAGGRGGGFCPDSFSNPVATFCVVGDFGGKSPWLEGRLSSRSYFRMVLRSTPVVRLICRWLIPLPNNVLIVAFRCGFKTFILPRSLLMSS